MKRARDTQREHVFRALEGVELAPQNVVGLFTTVRTSRWWANNLHDDHRQWVLDVEVDGRFAYWQCAVDGTIRLKRRDMAPTALLHQAAHYMTPKSVEPHGPEFVRALLLLAKRFCPDDHRPLVAALKEQNVQLRAVSAEGRQNMSVGMKRAHRQRLADDLEAILEDLTN